MKPSKVLRAAIKFSLGDMVVSNTDFTSIRNIKVDVLTDLRPESISDRLPPRFSRFRHYAVSADSSKIVFGGAGNLVRYAEVGVPFRRVIDPTTGLEASWVDGRFVSFGANADHGVGGRTKVEGSSGYNLEWWSTQVRYPFGSGYYKIRQDPCLLREEDTRHVGVVEQLEAAIRDTRPHRLMFPEVYVTSLTDLPKFDLSKLKDRALRVLWGEVVLHKTIAPEGVSQCSPVFETEDDNSPMVGLQFEFEDGRPATYVDLIPGYRWSVGRHPVVKAGSRLMDLKFVSDWVDFDDANRQEPELAAAVLDAVKLEATAEIYGYRAIDVRYAKPVKNGQFWVRGFTPHIQVLPPEYFAPLESVQPKVLTGSSGLVQWDFTTAKPYSSPRPIHTKYVRPVMREMVPPTLPPAIPAPPELVSVPAAENETSVAEADVVTSAVGQESET